MQDLIVVQHVKQISSNLCWAACCEMLSTRYGAPVSQAIFEQRHNQLYRHGLNTQASASECAKLLREYVPNLYPDVKEPPTNQGVILLPMIKKIIGQCRLIIAGREGHDYIICGWGSTSENVDFLYAHDPYMNEGPVRLNYQAFCNGWTTSVIVDNGVYAID